MTDFQKLWVGQTVSLFGSLVSRIALAWCAVHDLRATAWQLAALALCDRLPGFLLGLAAGVWVDRFCRRPLLLGADLLRAALVVLVPLAARTGHLDFSLLLAVSALTGALSTLFDIGYQAYIPTVADEGALVRANSRLSFTASLAEIGAFGLAGWLIQWLTAPGALWLDGGSFLVSAASLGAIRTRETPAPSRSEQGSLAALLGEARVGLSAIRAVPTLRRLLVGETSLALAMGATGTVYMLFVARELGFPAGELGLIFAVGGVTSLVGASMAERVAHRFGKERAAFLGLTVAGLGTLLNGLAPRAKLPGYTALIGNQIVTDPAWTIYEIQQTTLRQELPPPEVLGRVNATFRVAALGMGLLGTLPAGAITEKFSARLVILLSGLTVSLVGATLYCIAARDASDAR